MKRAADNLGTQNSGCYDLPLQLRINALALAVGQKPSFPEAAILASTEEKFGYAYQEHQLLAGKDVCVYLDGLALGWLICVFKMPV